MNKENKGPAQRGRRKPMAVFYWEKEWKGLFAKTAREVFNLDSSEAMRGILEEYVSCFMSDDELMEARKPQYMAYPPPRINRALIAAKDNRKSASSDAAGEKPARGGSSNRILDE
jgi:hypothetical protein